MFKQGEWAEAQQRRAGLGWARQGKAGLLRQGTTTGRNRGTKEEEEDN